MVQCRGNSRFASDWFPSRRSVDSHIGAFLHSLSGHDRWGNGVGLNGLYRVEGSALWNGESCQRVCGWRVDPRAVTYSIGMARKAGAGQGDSNCL
jgi:hypothetical protein